MAEGLTARQNNPAEGRNFAAMRAAFSRNSNLWDGCVCSPSIANSSTLFKKYFAKYLEDTNKVALNITAPPIGYDPDGTLKFVTQSVERYMEMLGGTGKFEKLECARRGPNTLLKATLTTFDELVKGNKIGGEALLKVNAYHLYSNSSLRKSLQ